MTRTLIFSFILLSICLLFGPTASAQLRPCSSEDDFSEFQSLEFYPFERFDSIEYSEIEDSLLFSGLSDFKVLKLAYQEYYIPREDEAGKPYYYKLNLFADLHSEYDYIQDPSLGDLVVLYGSEMNGRTSVRYGDGFSYQNDYCMLIDLKRWGHYGALQYRSNNEHWGQQYTTLAGDTISYSSLMDTISDPDYYPEDHLNVHYRIEQEGWDGQLEWGSDTIKMYFKVYHSETRTDHFLKQAEAVHQKADSCFIKELYLRDSNGIFSLQGAR